MLKVLPRQTVPNWLKEFEPHTAIDFKNVFEDSVYYPACGFDGDVLNLCVGFSHSFVYVDNLCSWSTTKADVIQYIKSPNNFWGFQSIFQKEFDEKDLVGRHDYDLQTLMYEDGSPELGLKPHSFFAILTIFDPISNTAQRERPPLSTLVDIRERFSFLYICTDGLIGFQRYYFSHKARAKGIAIIQPGDAFGGNWTSYYDQKKIFSRAVRNNKAGMPELMVFGGKSSSGSSIYRDPFWSDYPYRNYYFRAGGKAIATWTKNRINNSDVYFPTNINF